MRGPKAKRVQVPILTRPIPTNASEKAQLIFNTNSNPNRNLNPNPNPNPFHYPFRKCRNSGCLRWPVSANA